MTKLFIYLKLARFVQQFLFSHTSAFMFSILQVTIINSMGLTGRVVDIPVYHPYLDRNGLWLDVWVSYPDKLWPWVGFLSLHISVRSQAKKSEEAFSGIAEGWVSLKVESELSVGCSSRVFLSTFFGLCLYFFLTCQLMGGRTYYFKVVSSSLGSRSHSISGTIHVRD